MDAERGYAIGELARLAGVSVKTLRFWADRGVVPASGRDRRGHRVFDAAAVVRVSLVRTLRELGVDLATVRKVAEREAPLADVARAHAAAVAMQIGTLRRRYATLAAMARPGLSDEEMIRVSDRARLDDAERRRLIDAFLDDVFGGIADPALEGIRRSWTPVLPPRPAAAQRDAWEELAELTRDEDFRLTMRRVAVLFAEERARSGTGTVRRDTLTMLVQAQPRRERYEQLLATVNGWAADGPAEPSHG
nr:MerR family transcriptional regulator [uncultured Actinoplanes sp.]